MADKTYKVIAKLRNGKYAYFNDRRVRDGDELEVTEQQFSEKWMVQPEGKLPKKEPVKKSKPKAAPKSESPEETAE